MNVYEEVEQIRDHEIKNNNPLNKAQNTKNDEYYTRMRDIEKEMALFKNDLKGKRIVLPCDGPHSNFVKFFDAIKDEWGIAAVDNYEGAYETVDFSNYDVVITNPPFSKMLDFYKTITDAKIKFIILAHITFTISPNQFYDVSGKRLFIGNPVTNFVSPEGKIMKVATFWLNNIKRTHWSNDEAIEDNRTNIKGVLNVNAVSKINPKYNGKMAVPATILFKWDKYSKNYKLIGFNKACKYAGLKDYSGLKDANNKRLFTRAIIQRKRWWERKK